MAINTFILPAIVCLANFFSGNDDGDLLTNRRITTPVGIYDYKLRSDSKLRMVKLLNQERPTVNETTIIQLVSRLSHTVGPGATIFTRRDFGGFDAIPSDLQMVELTCGRLFTWRIRQLAIKEDRQKRVNGLLGSILKDRLFYNGTILMGSIDETKWKRADLKVPNYLPTIAPDDVINHALTEASRHMQYVHYSDITGKATIDAGLLLTYLCIASPNKTIFANADFSCRTEGIHSGEFLEQRGDDSKAEIQVHPTWGWVMFANSALVTLCCLATFIFSLKYPEKFKEIQKMIGSLITISAFCLTVILFLENLLIPKYKVKVV